MRGMRGFVGFLGWLALALILAPMVLRVGGRSWDESKGNPIVKGTSSLLGDWAKTAVSGGGFGTLGLSGSRALDAERRYKQGQAEIEAAKVAAEDAEIEAKAEVLRAQAVQKRLGIAIEWHPRITWKDVNPTTSGPVAVTVKVYRNDLPGGLTLVAALLCKRGDPPTNLESISLADGGEYLFQARVGTQPASAPFGPWVYIKGRAFQSPTGRTVLQEPLMLNVFL